MTKYLKIPPDPDSSPCRCTSGDPDCDHLESCPECGAEYDAHDGHDCLYNIDPRVEMVDVAKELRDSLDACETERDRLRAQIAALQSVPQGVELTEDDVRKALMSNAIDVDVEGVTPRLNRIIVSRLAPTPPQAAPGAQITFSQPETSPYLICDHCGGEMALTDGWVPTYSNPDNQGCNPSAEPYCPKCDAPHPLQPEERRVGPDDAVVSMDEWEALNAFLEDWRAPESRSLHDWNTSLKAKAARINALRTSAQAHNGEESK